MHPPPLVKLCAKATELFRLQSQAIRSTSLNIIFFGSCLNLFLQQNTELAPAKNSQDTIDYKLFGHAKFIRDSMLIYPPPLNQKFIVKSIHYVRASRIDKFHLQHQIGLHASNYYKGLHCNTS